MRLFAYFCKVWLWQFGGLIELLFTAFKLEYSFTLSFFSLGIQIICLSFWLYLFFQQRNLFLVSFVLRWKETKSRFCEENEYHCHCGININCSALSTRILMRQNVYENNGKAKFFLLFQKSWIYLINIGFPRLKSFT